MADSARSPAGTGRRSGILLVVLLAVSAMLAVVILVPAGIAAYWIYGALTAQPPAVAPVAQAPPIMAPVGPPPVKAPAHLPPSKKERGAPPALVWENLHLAEDDRPADKPAPPAPPAPPPVAADKVPEGPAAFVFMERTDAPAVVHGDYYNGILTREIARQSLLLVAREEFGLATRDPLLGEAAPAGMPESNVLRVASVFQQNKKLEIAMTHGPRANIDIPAGHVLRLNGPLKVLSYASLANLVDHHARTNMVAGLKRAGLTGRPNRYAPADGAAPDDLEDLLGQMTFTSEYQAIRRLHAHMHEKAESPGALGALVRAYANLGVLTEYQWDSGSKVFKSRALLYGYRMVNRLPKDAPSGHWHLAYAYALVGLHVNALEELGKATVLQKAGLDREGKEPGFAPRPAWVGIIDAYCHYDIARLKQAAEDGHGNRLAQLLWFISAESDACPELTAKVGEAVLAANPECYRVHDGICRVGRLGVRQSGTLRAPAFFAKHFPQRLAEMPGLPDAIARRLAGGAAMSEPELFRALREAGNSEKEPCEFSWAVLAHLARETRFAQTAQRLDFMRYMWTVPTAEAANQVLPSIADHPYEPFIRSFTLDRYREVEQCRALLAKLPLSDMLPSQQGLLRAYEECKVPNLYYVQHLATVSMDMVPYDVRLVAPRYDKQPAGITPLARGLLAIAPHSPLARGLSIHANWDAVSKDAAAWEKDAQHPQVLMFLGEHYIGAGQFDDAARCLERAIGMSPEYRAFVLLADAHRNARRMDQWQAALDRYLALNPPGLEPARVRVMIAQELMRHKQWGKAQPYADAAAGTGADWAMQCACECYTGLGRFDVAEQWIRRSTERYPNSYTQWFMWCKRTGRGDLTAASKVVTDRFKDVSQIALPVDLQEMGFYYTLTGRPEQAMWAFKSLQKAMPTADIPALMLALAQDENEQFGLRDKLLQGFPKGTSPLLWLAPFYREALARGEKTRPDLAAADKHMAAMPAPLQPVAAYFVGRFLEQHRFKEDAIRYYRRCVDAPEVKHQVFRTLAIDRLRVLGVKDAKTVGLDL